VTLDGDAESDGEADAAGGREDDETGPEPASTQ
jgi:hypothetical protein